MVQQRHPLNFQLVITLQLLRAELFQLTVRVIEPKVVLGLGHGCESIILEVITIMGVVVVMGATEDMADLTQQSGSVWVQALIDKAGRVRDARILKPSGTQVGFEEAALAAAFEAVYKPAIQNGQPVAVWISYKVEFRFRR